MTPLSVLRLRILNQLQLVSTCQALEHQLGGKRQAAECVDASSVSVCPDPN